MKDITIKAQVWLLGAVAVLGILVAALFGIVTLARVDARQEAALQDVSDGMRQLVAVETAAVDFKTQVQEWKNILIRGNDAAEYDKHVQAFSGRQAAVQEGLTKTRDAIKAENDPNNGDVLQMLDAVIKEHAALGALYQSALGGFDKGDPGAGLKLDAQLKGKDRPAAKAMADVVARMEKGERAHLEAQIAEGRTNYLQARNFLITVTVLAAVIALALALTASRRIVHQIAVVQRTTEQARAELDLTRRIPLHGRDEMGQVASAVNALLEEFQTVVGSMKQSAEAVLRTAGSLTHSVDTLASSVANQNDATNSMAASVEELAVTASHVSDAATAAENTAQTSLDQAESGGRVIGETVQRMDSMASTVRSTSQSMETLGQRTEEIGSIARVIKEIADQTNLLALNAAIEAARAGEQGRGFAVVADEVRKLAERTTNATGEISGLITSIQAESRNAISEMHALVQQVGETAEVTSAAGTAMESIQGGSRQVLGVSRDIRNALKEQSSASELIAKQVEVISAMSEENTEAMRETREASHDLSTLSQAMHQAADRFRV
ncbi:methyl-accepting chemotaxis protein [Niveibacterium sp.]|uniref:methyl-accepting chemotaxis protein n=1 Tax=Niveibacterium sp. TaxID=2017444 RepID=UPI0035B1434C